MRAAVVVLGDLGRSPRMMYHANSLASLSNCTAVDLIGYGDSKLHTSIENNPKIQQHHVRTPNFLLRLPRSLFTLFAPFKAIAQLLSLFWILCFAIQRPDVYLVQNPPSIPTLFAVWIASRLRGSKFIIDWHNLGYSVLALSIGKSHPLVRISKFYERMMGRKADVNFCVSKAMSEFLLNEWRIHATVLHDRPPPMFDSLSVERKHETMMQIQQHFQIISNNPIQELEMFFDHRPEHDSNAEFQNRSFGVLEETIITQRLESPPSSSNSIISPSTPTSPSNRKKSAEESMQAAERDIQILSKSGQGRVQMKQNRPVLIVSSTSWTADEDFGILLNAIQEVDRRSSSSHNDSSHPSFVFVITGKGPQKAMYEQKIKEMEMKNCVICTAWLPSELYPAFLGCCDLGVCLHYSSSGIDLPMKVVDMFGTGLPVCAIGYRCLEELVENKKNGLIFDSSQQLAEQILDLFDGFNSSPNGGAKLNDMRRYLRAFQNHRWQHEWADQAAPVFERIAVKASN